MTIVGDWNVHYSDWASEGDSIVLCARGRKLREHGDNYGWSIKEGIGSTWERKRGERAVR